MRLIPQIQEDKPHKREGYKQVMVHFKAPLSNHPLCVHIFSGKELFRKQILIQN
jgi:hypothetical protein